MVFPPAATDFKGLLVRDFNYGSGFDNVRDADINQALTEAAFLFNTDIWDTTPTGDGPIAYCYLAAHIMVLNIQAAGGLSALGSEAQQGVNSQGQSPIASKSVGAVSVNYALSEVANSPILSQFMRTNYGQKYLALLMPRLVGAGTIVPGIDETGSSAQINV